MKLRPTPEDVKRLDLCGRDLGDGRLCMNNRARCDGITQCQWTGYYEQIGSVKYLCPNTLPDGRRIDDKHCGAHFQLGVTGR